jgi:hypothetical protein
MQTFYVIIKKDYLLIYEKKGDVYERVYLKGKLEYAYSVNSAKDCAARCLNTIFDEYNLDTMGEIDLIVIDNEDEIITNAMSDAFGENVKKRIKIEKLMSEVSASIGRDKKLRISEYGINYDGKKYLVRDGKVEKEEFSLLSYTLTDDMLMKFVG